jgi:hypothetical protein
MGRCSPQGSHFRRKGVVDQPTYLPASSRNNSLNGGSQASECHENQKVSLDAHRHDRICSRWLVGNDIRQQGGPTEPTTTPTPA